jgi:hypothetical protein
MKCGFCGRHFTPAEAVEKESCGRCLSGCQKAYCPYCGYGNPLIPGFLERWIKNKDKNIKE